MPVSYYYGFNEMSNDIKRKMLLKEFLFSTNRPFFKFKYISVERKKEISLLAQEFTDKHTFVTEEERFYQIISYLKQRRNISANKKLLVGDESFLFFIFAFDPKLKALKIFFEEEEEEERTKRYLEEFHFSLDTRLIELEWFYNLRFPKFSNEKKLTR